MSVPKKRRTKASKRRRASHHAITSPASASCYNCKRSIKPHHACQYCGHYRGREIMNAVKQPTKSLAAKSATTQTKQKTETIANKK